MFPYESVGWSRNGEGVFWNFHGVAATNGAVLSLITFFHQIFSKFFFCKISVDPKFHDKFTELFHMEKHFFRVHVTLNIIYYYIIYIYHIYDIYIWYIIYNIIFIIIYYYIISYTNGINLIKSSIPHIVKLFSCASDTTLQMRTALSNFLPPPHHLPGLDSEQHLNNHAIHMTRNKFIPNILNKFLTSTPFIAFLVCSKQSPRIIRRTSKHSWKKTKITFFSWSCSYPTGN